jgi:hypothetical protein
MVSPQLRVHTTASPCTQVTRTALRTPPRPPLRVSVTVPPRAPPGAREIHPPWRWPRQRAASHATLLASHTPAATCVPSHQGACGQRIAVSVCRTQREGVRGGFVNKGRSGACAPCANRPNMATQTGQTSPTACTYSRNCQTTNTRHKVQADTRGIATTRGQEPRARTYMSLEHVRVRG